MKEFVLYFFGCGLISLPLTAIFLAITDRKRFLKNWTWVVMFVLYMNAAFMIVGVPDISSMYWMPIINWIPFTDFSIGNITGMMLNAFLFMPFGGFCALYFKEFQNLKKNLLAGFLLSFLIEIMQLATIRATDADDIIMNTLGTLLGFIVAKTFLKKSLIEEKAKDELKLTAMVLIVLLSIFFSKAQLMLY